jgi:NADH-quinone oxidoreductase subunit C
MTKEQIENKLTKKFGNAVEVQQTKNPEAFIYVTKEKYLELCQFLKDDSDLYFDYLFQLGGVHYPDRFEVMVTLSSHKHKHELVIKTKLPLDSPHLPTVSHIWETANWHEREVMELFGIMIDNHPDPRPLLLYDDWDFGYPLRKGWTGPDFIPMPDKSKGADE